MLWLIWGARWVRGKKPGFLQRKALWQRKPRFNKQGFYTCLWSGHLALFHTSQYHFIWWTLNLNLHPGTLVRPTSLCQPLEHFAKSSTFLGQMLRRNKQSLGGCTKAWQCQRWFQLGEIKPHFEHFLLGTASWSKKQDAGMLAGNAKRIFCDNITCFGTNESCWNRSHLPEFFIKDPHFLRALLLCFFTQTPPFYIFLGGDQRKHPRLSWPEQFTRWFGKWGSKNVICPFCIAIFPGSFRFRAWCGDFQFRGCISTRTLSASKATHLMSIQPNMKEAGEKLKKTRSLCVVCGVLQLSEIESDSFEIFQSQFGNPRISPFEFLLYRHCLLIEETRRWNAGWQR